MRNVLVFGRDGQLASELLPRLASRSHFKTRSIEQPDIDLARRGEAGDLILSEQPWLVINTAAYTAVDRAESERDLAFAVNADAVGEIAQNCARVGAALVHISTDYVFDGRASTPYTENDPIGPRCVYGESKAQGEAQIRAALGQHIILRTSWLFARAGNNFVRTMLRLALKGSDIAVVDDQLGIPTSAAHLADLIVAMADRLAAAAPGPFGTFHAVGGKPVTWYAFADATFAAGLHHGLPGPQKLRPTTSEAYPTAAARPRFSVLDSSALAREWGLAVAPWTDDFDATVASILGDLQRAGR